MYTYLRSPFLYEPVACHTPTRTRSVEVVVAGQVPVGCVGGVEEVAGGVTVVTGAPQAAFVKPSLEPGREAGSLSRMSTWPFFGGCAPVDGLCACIHAVYGMLMTTYGFESEPVRWQMMTW